MNIYDDEEQQPGPGPMTMTNPFGSKTMIPRPQPTPEGGHVFMPPQSSAPTPTPQQQQPMGVKPPAGTQGQGTGTPAPQSDPTPQPSSPVPAPASPAPVPRPAGSAGTTGTAAPGTAMDAYNKVVASGNTPASGLNYQAAKENLMRETARQQGVSDAAYPEWLRVQQGGLTPADQERARQARMQEERDQPGGLGDQRDAAQQAAQAAAFAPRFGPSSESGAITDPAYLAAQQRAKDAQAAYDQNLATARAPQTDPLQALIRGEAGGGAPTMAPRSFDGSGPGEGYPRNDVLSNLLQQLEVGAGGPTMAPQGTATDGPRGPTPLSGTERPGAVNAPSGPASPLSGALEQKAMQQLENPSVYDDALYKGQLDQAKADLGDWYDSSKQELDADLANRGIDFSTIAGTRQAQLVNDRSRKMNEVMLPILRDRAMSLGSARSAAFNNARGILGDVEDRGFRGRQEERGERGYRDDLRREARRNAIEEQGIATNDQRYEDDRMQQLIDRMLGVGYGGAGQGAAGQAGSLYGSAGNQYGNSASDIEDELGQFIEMLLSGAYSNN